MESAATRFARLVDVQTFALEPRDHLVEALLRHLGAEVLAVISHVGDTLDYDVVDLPAVVGLAHAIVDRHHGAAVAPHFGANNGLRRTRLELERQYLEPVGGEVGDRAGI